MILFSCFWCIAIIAAVPQQGERQLWSDVEVFGSARDGIRSQSISFADPNGGSVERFPRQLDTVHEHFRAAKLPIEEKKQKKKKKEKASSFDSDYDRFINEHFRQDYQGYSPESESEQMARDHEEFQELPHYYRKSHPVNYAKTPSGTSYWPRRRQSNFKIHSNGPRTIQEDVEDYQPNDETLAIRSNSDSDNSPPSDDYQRIKQLSEQQAKDTKKNEAHCKATKKSDMLCQVCFNPKTGAKSESCSYAPKPHSKKYAFSEENNYSSKNENSSEEEEEADDEEENEDEENNEDGGKPEIHTNTPLRKRNQSKMARGPRIKRGNGWEEYKDISTVERRSTGESKKIETYDDFFGSPSLFPEYQKYQTENVKEGEDDDGEKYEFMPRTSNHKAVAVDVDAEETLAEFRKRDWSDCKKARKGELTCYVCEDRHGDRHEECMFLSSSSSSSSSTSLNPSGLSRQHASRNGTDETMSSHEDDYRERDGVEEVGGGVASGSVSVKDFPANDKDIVAEHSRGVLTAEEGVPRATNGGVSRKGVSRNKKNNVKLNRKLVIKKRKLKQQQGDYLNDGSEGVRQEASANGQSSPLKRRIRKKVTYRKPAKNWKQQEGIQPLAVETSVIFSEDQK